MINTIQNTILVNIFRIAKEIKNTNIPIKIGDNNNEIISIIKLRSLTL